MADRDSEGASVATATRDATLVATVTAAILMGQQVAGKATRDALFLTSFTVRSLPLITVTTSVVSMASAILMTRALRRFTPARAVPALFLASAALQLVEWGLSQTMPAVAAIAYYLHTAVFGATVTSGFWSVMSERFDPRTARSVIGPVTNAGTLGSVIGGLIAWRASDLVGVRTMLLLLAAMNAFCLVGVARLGRGTAADDRAPRARAPLPSVAEAAPEGRTAASTGLASILKEPYLRALSLMVGLGSLTQVLLDFVLSARVAQEHGQGHGLLSAFAVFYTVVGVLTVIVQATCARGALDRFGLDGTVAFVPIGAVVGAVTMGLIPGVPAAMLGRATEATLRGSLYRMSYELFFTPLAPDQKRSVKPIIDVLCDKIGAAIGGGVTLLLVRASPHATIPFVMASVAVVSLVSLVVTRALHVGYVTSLAGSLKSGAVRLRPDDVADATTRKTLAATMQGGVSREQILAAIEAVRAQQPSAPDLEADGGVGAFPADPVLDSIRGVRSREPRVVDRVLAMRPLEPSLVAHVLPLLVEERWADKAQRCLRAAADRISGQLGDALASPDVPAPVRAQVARALKAATKDFGLAGLRRALVDADGAVRDLAAQSLLHRRKRDQDGPLDVPRVVEAVRHELRTTTDLKTAKTRVFALLQLGFDPEAMQNAREAMAHGEAALRGTALEYLEVVLPDELRGLVFELLGEAPPKRKKGAAGPPDRAAVADELKRKVSNSIRAGKPEEDDRISRTGED